MKVPLTLTFDTSDNETNAEVKGSLALTCRRNLKSLLEDIVEEKTLLPLFLFFFFKFLKKTCYRISIDTARKSAIKLGNLPSLNVIR